MQLVTVFAFKSAYPDGYFFAAMLDDFANPGIPTDQLSSALRTGMFLIALRRKHPCFY